MHMDDGFVAWQGFEQGRPALRPPEIPGSLRGGSQARGVAMEIGLIKTDDLYAGGLKLWVERSDRREHDCPVTMTF